MVLRGVGWKWIFDSCLLTFAPVASRYGCKLSQSARHFRHRAHPPQISIHNSSIIYVGVYVSFPTSRCEFVSHGSPGPKLCFETAFNFASVSLMAYIATQLR